MLMSFTNLMKYGRPSGVVHVGAHEGQEAKFYHEQGVNKMIFIEALPHIYERLCDNIKPYPEAIAFQACVSDQDDIEVTFNISSNEGQSSSMLKFGTHAVQHPDVTFIDELQLKTSRLDTLLKGLEGYNLLVMDLQGAELLALKGLGNYLNNFDYIYCEVNKDHLYEGCPLIGEIDDFLTDFKRVEMSMTRWGWGDAYYIRKKKIVRTQFQPDHPVIYPPDNVDDFEKWFFDNYQPEGDREYIPVFWTAYQVLHHRNPRALKELQHYINSLDRSKKYFTVVQHDDGILVNLPFDCKIFAMSGKRIDYALPLVCTPHEYVFDLDRDYFCNFIGGLTHPVRKSLTKVKNGYISFKKHTLEDYCNILSRSVFTLCPRGYGPTSFRIAEALQYGSVPVYISDRHIIPHGIDFNSYGVLIGSNDQYRVEQILNSITPEQIKAKQEDGRRIYKEYFTYEANLKIIQCELKPF